MHIVILLDINKAFFTRGGWIEVTGTFALNYTTSDLQKLQPAISSYPSQHKLVPQLTGMYGNRNSSKEKYIYFRRVKKDKWTNRKENLVHFLFFCTTLCLSFNEEILSLCHSAKVLDSSLNTQAFVPERYDTNHLRQKVLPENVQGSILKLIKGN